MSGDEILKQLINENSINEEENTEVFCQRCNDKGYLLVDSDIDGVQQSIICACRKDEIWKSTFIKAGVLAEFIGLTIDSAWNIKQDAFGHDLGIDASKKEKIGQFFKKYIYALPALAGGIKLSIQSSKTRRKIKINSLLLIGGWKSGKSLLASILVQEAIKKGLKSKVYDWIDLCNILSEYDYKEEHDILSQEFYDLDIVVIDGVQDYNVNSPCFLMQLDRISKSRLRTGKPTIITADANYINIRSGNTWKSLVDSCFIINLPSKQNKEQSSVDTNLQVKTLNKTTKSRKTSEE